MLPLLGNADRTSIEITHRVFGFLDRSTLCKSAQVSKTWHQFIYSYFFRISKPFAEKRKPINTTRVVTDKPYLLSIYLRTDYLELLSPRGDHVNENTLRSIRMLDSCSLIIQNKKLELKKQRESHPQNTPAYLDELLDNGHLHLYDHLMNMRILASRNDREEEIKQMPFSELSHVVLETRKAIIQKVEQSLPDKLKPVLFLLGGSGAGKSTTLCFLRGDEMLCKDFHYESKNDQNQLIGHGQATSCTFLPTVQMINHWTIVDFPGFDDTSGPLISLGMECALKALVAKYQPKILVLESITNTEGRFAAAAELGLRLQRLLSNKEHCLLGITKYCKDPDFIQIREIEEQQKKERSTPTQKEVELIAEIKMAQKYKAPQEAIEEMGLRLAKMNEEKAEQLNQPLPETEQKTQSRNNILARENEILKQIGLQGFIPFHNLEYPTHPSSCLAKLAEIKAIEVNFDHHLDPGHEKLIDYLFVNDLEKKLETDEFTLEKLKDFEGRLEDFEKSVRETSLLNTIFILSNPEIGQFVHLPEIDFHIVRNYDKKIVTTCIDKFIRSLILGIDIPPVEILIKKVGNRVPEEKIKKLETKFVHLKKYLMGILGVDLHELKNSEQLEKKWEEIRKRIQTRVDVVDKEFALSSWIKVLMGIPLGIPLGIHALIKWQKQTKEEELAIEAMIDESFKTLDQMHKTLTTLKDLETLIKDKDNVLLKVKENGLELQYVDQSFKRNKEIVLAAVTQNGLALQFADESLKRNKEIVIVAITQNGLALQFADESLKNNKEVVLTAVIHNGNTLAYGKQHWEKYFGDIGEDPPLPPDILQILNSPCPFWLDKKVKDTHMLVLIPSSVNGKPLTMKNLGELVKTPKQGNASKYRYLNLGDYEKKDAAVIKSYWVLMTRDVLEGTRSKSYTEQTKIVAGFREKTGIPYEVPHILEATVCIFMIHTMTGTKLYGDSPYTYTRCQEAYNKDWQLVSGGFSASGLDVGYYYDFRDVSCVAVAAVRKF